VALPPTEPARKAVDEVVGRLAAQPSVTGIRLNWPFASPDEASAITAELAAKHGVHITVTGQTMPVTQVQTQGPARPPQPRNGGFGPARTAVSEVLASDEDTAERVEDLLQTATRKEIEALAPGPRRDGLYARRVELNQRIDTADTMKVPDRDRERCDESRGWADRSGRVGSSQHRHRCAGPSGQPAGGRLLSHRHASSQIV
jgi:hypothetical protein